MTAKQTQQLKPLGDYPESNEIMGRMRWLTVVLPLCFLLVLLVLELQYLRKELSGLEAVVLGFTVSAIGIVVFSRSVFEVVERLQMRLREQNADLRSRTNLLEAVRAAGLQVASHIDLATVLQRIADSSRSLVDAQYAAIAIVRDGKLAELVTSGMTPEQVAAFAGPPEGKGLLGHVLKTARPYRSSDISTDPHAEGLPLGHPSMKQFLGVPILSRGSVIGNIYLTNKEAGDFTDEDELAIGMLAVQAGVAIENARLYEEGREVAVLKERERIAMALHDGAIQALYGVGLQIESSMDRIDSEPAVARGELDEAIEGINAVIRDFRSHIFDLRPHQYKGRTLLESCRELLRDLSVNTLIVTKLVVDEGDPDPSEDLSMEQIESLFQIAEETLDRIRARGKARGVTLDMARQNGTFWMRIVEEGVTADGAEQDEGASEGFDRMLERARAVGGGLEVASGPGGGLFVHVTVPMGPDRKG